MGQGTLFWVGLAASGAVWGWLVGLWWPLRPRPSRVAWVILLGLIPAFVIPVGIFPAAVFVFYAAAVLFLFVYVIGCLAIRHRVRELEASS